MARTWIIDSRGLAKKVKSAGLPVAHQIKDCGAKRQCPNCHCHIDNSDVFHDWPGLPLGVKFDPSDVELLKHLAAKSGVGDSEPHKLIDEFIPTLDGDEGICYTHPENLPGAKKDGSCIHFFYKIANAYTSGPRKRRRIQDAAQVRWHKTGKTKPVMETGVQKGCKKIMVLYETSKRGSKPDKRNWVMHQYHLGPNEDEREGEYVVSKIFYQIDKQEISESDVGPTARGIPATPKMNTPDPPRDEKTPVSDYVADDYFQRFHFLQDSENVKKPWQRSFGSSQLENETNYASCLAGESQAEDLPQEDFLFCNEKIDSQDIFGDLKPDNTANMSDAHPIYGCGSSAIVDLENIELDTPPDYQLSDLQFPSQDSVFDWLERL